MKICDVVMNSIWYDPRVRKQIIMYDQSGIELSCVGFMCKRYNSEMINKIPCDVSIAEIDQKYAGKQPSLFRKIKRDYLTVKAVRDAIIGQQPDLIHANDLDALIPAFLASKKLKCKLIYDSHEICVENYTNGRNWAYAAAMKLIERYIVKRVDLMVCVSHAAANYFTQTYQIKKPMVITNCALQSEIIHNKEKNEGFEFLNHGQFYNGRGYDIMANACELLVDYPEIILAFRGFGELESNLRERVKQSQNSEQARFYPKVNVEELIPLASRSHVGIAITEPICLNFELSVSNKLFEYLAAGLPVIMSDIPEHRYLNEKYRFGIILENNSPECFAEAVIKMYSDNEFYCECRENAKKTAKELNWENEFAKLIEAERKLFR